MRWLLVLVLCLLVFNRFGDWMARHGFGRLPGDIAIERPGLRVYFPWVTMLVVSLVVSLLLRLFRR